MKYLRYTPIVVTVLIAIFIAGCDTKFGHEFTKQVDSTKTGIFDTKTNIEEGLSKTCADEPKVTEQADEVLRLVSSEEQTLFIVDGKDMGRAKQLKVCIDSKGDHTVTAEAPGCEAKIEKMTPPYDFPVYQFQFMLAECKTEESQVLQPMPQPVKKQVRRKSKR